MNNSRGASTKSPAVAQIDMDSAQDRDKKFWLQGQLKKLIILTLCLGIIIALLATAILIVRFYISYYVVQGHKFDTQGLGIFWPYIILALIILKDILIMTGIPLIIAWVIIRFVKTDVIRGRDIQESTMKFLQFHLTFSLVVVLITLLGTIVFSDAILKHVQIWWILFLDIAISLALATDFRPKHLQRSLPRVLISRKMITNIIVHVIYQLAVVLLILLFADKFINVNNGLYERPGSPPSKHFTIIFQTLCLMNIYNAITSRLLFDSISWKKWNGDRNCCEDHRNNFIFHIVLFVLIVLQILIVEFGGAWLWTTSIADQLWICFLFAFIELLLGQIFGAKKRMYDASNEEITDNIFRLQ